MRSRPEGKAGVENSREGPSCATPPLHPLGRTPPPPPPHPSFPSLPIHKQQERPSASNRLPDQSASSWRGEPVVFPAPQGSAHFLAPANAQSSLPNDGWATASEPHLPGLALPAVYMSLAPPHHHPYPEIDIFHAAMPVPWQRSSTWLARPNLTANEALRGRKVFRNQEKNEP